MDDDALIEDIAGMALPQIASGTSLCDWSYFSSLTATALGVKGPPAIAFLRGAKGFNVRITDARCILGKASRSAEDLVSALGGADRGAEGLVFEYNNSMKGGMVKSDNSRSKEENPAIVPLFPSVHIGFHSSIARRHALIDWDTAQREFRIQSLSEVGVMVDGLHVVMPGDPPHPLKHRSIIQIGCKIFYFFQSLSLPAPASRGSPLIHNLNVVDAITASVQYRALLTKFNQPMDAKAEEEAVELAQMMMDRIEQSEAKVVGEK